jgi:hypothetical protein
VIESIGSFGTAVAVGPDSRVDLVATATLTAAIHRP